MLIAAGASAGAISGSGAGSGSGSTKAGAARAKRRGNGGRGASAARGRSERCQPSSNPGAGSGGAGASSGSAGGSVGGGCRKSLANGSEPRLSARSRSRLDDEANSRLRLGRSDASVSGPPRVRSGSDGRSGEASGGGADRDDRGPADIGEAGIGADDNGADRSGMRGRARGVTPSRQASSAGGIAGASRSGLFTPGNCSGRISASAGPRVRKRCEHSRESEHQQAAADAEGSRQDQRVADAELFDRNTPGNRSKPSQYGQSPSGQHRTHHSNLSPNAPVPDCVPTDITLVSCGCPRPLNPVLVEIRDNLQRNFGRTPGSPRRSGQARHDRATFLRR